MNIFRKLLASPIVGVKWVRALELASAENYQAALGELDYLDEFYSGKNIEYHLLRGLVNYALSDDSSAVENLKLSISLLRNTTRYNEDERDYLLCYGTTLCRKAAKSVPNLIDLDSLPQVDVSTVKLANVKHPLRKSFPLTDHPQWK